MPAEPALVPASPAALPGTRRVRWLRLGAGLAVVLAIVMLHLGGLSQKLSWETVRTNLDVWQAFARARPLLAVAVFALAYVALTSLSLPAALMLFLSGALFDRVLGTAVASGSSACGAAVTFLAGRYLFRDWVRDRFGKRLRKIDRGFECDGAWYLLTLRMMPVVPFLLVNVGMALSPMRLRTFVLVTWIGMLPACLLYVHAGSTLGRLDTPGDALSPAVIASLMVLALLPLAARWGMRRPEAAAGR